MNKRTIQKLKRRLLSMEGEILEKLNGQREELLSILYDDSLKDELDLAEGFLDSATLGALSSYDKERLETVHRALQRLHNGKYGRCVTCNKQIPEGRLEAMPYALECCACKQRSERRFRRGVLVN